LPGSFAARTQVATVEVSAEQQEWPLEEPAETEEEATE
jgi:hypothetical protein